MKIGYACLTIGVPQANFRTCIMKNATEELLLEIIEANLNSLENIIDYNIENEIKLFRISSDIIPFGSSDVNTFLNSPKEDVVIRAIKDLEYHNRFLDGLGLGRESKIILHIEDQEATQGQLV